MSDSPNARLCPHLKVASPPHRWRMCEHLISEHREDVVRRWHARGDAHDMLCEACGEGWAKDASSLNDEDLYVICRRCFLNVDRDHDWYDAHGSLSLLEATPQIAHEEVVVGSWEIDFLPYEGTNIAPTSDGEGCYVVDTARDLWFVSEELTVKVFAFADAQVEFGSESQRVSLVGPSPCGNYVAVCDEFGQFGYVVDLVSGAKVMDLDRGDYHPEQTSFPVAFFTWEDRTLMVHTTAWNIAHVTDPENGQCLTAREPDLGEDGRPIREHYLDYFYGELIISPNQRTIASGGWVWSPIGVVEIWDLGVWLSENVWEAERGESKLDAQVLVGDDWGWPMCFLSDDELAKWGVAGNERIEVAGIVIADTKTGEIRDFIGASEHGVGALMPWRGKIAALGKESGLQLFDRDSGERICALPTFTADGFERESERWFRRVEGAIQVIEITEAKEHA